MSRVRDLASILTASSVLGTDVEVSTAVSNHSSATDPHGDRANTTTQISTHAAATDPHGDRQVAFAMSLMLGGL
jgi:hypothetical protein